jgi:hypothetical protein
MNYDKQTSPKKIPVRGCFIIIIFCFIVLLLLLPKPKFEDDPSLPSKGVTVDSLLPYKTFDLELRNNEQFNPKFFLISENGKLPMPDNISFDHKDIAKTIEGARTAVFLRWTSQVVGQWHTFGSGSGKGLAKSVTLQICCVDILNPNKRKIVTLRHAPPDSRTTSGSARDDDEDAIAFGMLGEFLRNLKK